MSPAWLHACMVDRLAFGKHFKSSRSYFGIVHFPHLISVFLISSMAFFRANEVYVGCLIGLAWFVWMVASESCIAVFIVKKVESQFIIETTIKNF
jgi:hypothetical protein